MNMRITIRGTKYNNTLRCVYKQTEYFRHPRRQLNFVCRHPTRRCEIRVVDLLDLERLDRPILLRIVQNSPVRAKFAHPGTSRDALL